MATIEIAGDKLVVHIQGWDKILALRSTVTVPLEHVTGVTVRPPEANNGWNAPGWKLAGAYIPNKIAAGMFWVDGGLAFYDVHDPAKTVGIRLEHEYLNQVIVQVDDETPEDAAERIKAALAAPS